MSAVYISIDLVVRKDSLLGQIINGDRKVTVAELEPVLAADPVLSDNDGWERLYTVADEEQEDFDPGKPPTVEHWVALCERVLNAMGGLYVGECATDELGQGTRVYTSGGLTWGDWPSESYELMDNLHYLPESVLKFVGFQFTDPRAEAFRALARIDYGQLAEQRVTLAGAQEHETDPATSEALMGVLNLLDSLDDYARQHLPRTDSTAPQPAPAPG